MPAFRWWTKAPRSLTARSISGYAVSGVFLGMLLCGGQALALSEDACIKDEKCKDHYSKAVKLYKDEEYDAALAEFQAAYSARAMPILLVNIGRTLQKLGRPKEALGYYERFLAAESKVDAETKKRVDDYITQVKALIGTEPEKTDKPAAVEPQKPAQPVAPAAPPPPPPPPPGRGLVILGSVVAAVGVAGLGAAIGLGVMSQGQYNTFQMSTDEFDKLAAKSSARVLGLAVGATGGALIGVGVQKMRAAKAEKDGKAQPSASSPAAPQAMVLPWASASGAGFVLQGGF
jgi:tetratricopeptide (TPR) repeat protein